MSKNITRRKTKPRRMTGREDNQEEEEEEEEE